MFYVNHTDVSFHNITFKNGYTFEDGGAITTNDDSVIYHAVNCNFINNSAAGSGGAMNGGRAVYDIYALGCTFDGNEAYDGGAMFNSASAYGPAASDCIFINNYAENNGGAVYTTGGDYNTAKKEGASYFTEDAENDTVVNDCFFSGNIDHYDKKLNEEYHDAWKKLQEKMEIELEDKKLPIDERTKKELPIGRINP